MNTSDPTLPLFVSAIMVPWLLRSHTGDSEPHRYLARIGMWLVPLACALIWLFYLWSLIK